MFIPKINLALLTGKSLDCTEQYRIATTVNPPLHPILFIFDQACELDIRNLFNNKSSFPKYDNLNKVECDLLNLLKDFDVRIMKPDKGGVGWSLWTGLFIKIGCLRS